MSQAIINAHPFIMTSSGDPVIIANDGEYTAMCNSAKTVFLFKSSEMVSSIPSKVNAVVQSRVSTQISIRLFSTPVVLATNGSPQVVIYKDNVFKCQRIPIFAMAKFCAILSSNIFIVAETHSAYYWNYTTNKCQLCFTSEREIQSLDYYQGKTYIFTSNTFEILSSDSPAMSINMNFPPQSRIRHSFNFNSYFILNGTVITPLYIEGTECSRKSDIILPDKALDFCVIGKSLLVLFQTRDGRKRFVKKYNIEADEWSGQVDVPLISIMNGCGGYVLATCPQFTLILHEIPKIFDQISQGTPLPNLLLSFDNTLESFQVLALFFGLDKLVAELSNHNPSSQNLVDFVLDELWHREMYDQWGFLALEWPKYLKSQNSSNRIVELLKTRKFAEDSNIQFATILEASADYWNAFLIYLKAKNVESVEAILQYVIDRIEPHISELIDLCTIGLKTGHRDASSRILRALAAHPKEAKPERVLPHLMFSWDLLEMYCKGFETPPLEVVNSYLNGLAIYQPNRLRDFLTSNAPYDASRACDSLLKLGCLDEYGYVLSKVNTQRYLEFLVLREDWDTLFKFLEGNKKEWPYVLKMMVYDKSYFVEFVRHFDMFEITLTEMLGEIPKECDPPLLADGFRYLAKVISSRNESEIVVEDICSHESFQIFDELLMSRNEETVIEL